MMINRSQKFIFNEFASIIAGITEHPKDTAPPCTDQIQFLLSFSTAFLIADRSKEAERSKTGQKGR